LIEGAAEVPSCVPSAEASGFDIGCATLGCTRVSCAMNAVAKSSARG
jgi:hypothetical protein